MSAVLTLQFVDAIGSSPNVLLDLSNGAPFGVLANGWSAPPPALQRSSSSSSSRDGSSVAQSAYSDREIAVTLTVNSTTSDEATEAIQTLGRLLNAGGQWLRFQRGTIEPVFFRTKRAEIVGFDEFNGQEDGFRTATLSIPAEPFTYGEAVTGSATVANDPTAATNPMSFVFPDVHGDVATPLWLSWDAKARPDYLALGSMAVASTDGEPNHLVVTSSALPPASGGYSIADSADSDSVGGIKRLVTHASGSATQDVTGALVHPVLTEHAIDPGDYRVLVRCDAAYGSSWAITFEAYGRADEFSVVRTYVGCGEAQWVDMGVFRLPLSFPMVNDLYSGPSPAALFRLLAKGNTNATAAKFDDILFVPAGVDAATDTRLSFANAIGADSTVVVDGAADLGYWWDSSDPGVDTFALSGGMPRVVPGCANVLTWVTGLPSATFGIGTEPAHVLSETTDIEWAYYPRYLYDRPAST